jgi:Plasmid pRiA4b ORF-3-like protein
VTTAAEARVYQIKVTLTGVSPPIWRRLLVSSSTSLKQLHDILQTAIGWTDSHLHQFIARGQRYGRPDPELDVDVINEARVSLGQILRREKEWMSYEYDFGDGWTHKIVLEKVLTSSGGQAIPSCTAGSRSCPPEDCGGTWGYEEFLKAIGDPTHPEHDEMVEWIGGDFDPEHFDIAEVNALLAPRTRRGPTSASTRTPRKRGAG